MRLTRRPCFFAEPVPLTCVLMASSSCHWISCIHVCKRIIKPYVCILRVFCEHPEEILRTDLDGKQSATLKTHLLRKCTAFGDMLVEQLNTLSGSLSVVEMATYGNLSMTQPG